MLYDTSVLVRADVQMCSKLLHRDDKVLANNQKMMLTHPVGLQCTGTGQALFARRSTDSTKMLLDPVNDKGSPCASRSSHTSCNARHVSSHLVGIGCLKPKRPCPGSVNKNPLFGVLRDHDVFQRPQVACNAASTRTKKQI